MSDLPSQQAHVDQSRGPIPVTGVARRSATGTAMAGQTHDAPHGMDVTDPPGNCYTPKH